MCVWSSPSTPRALCTICPDRRYASQIASESSPAVQHHGRGGATPHVRKHGTVPEFGDRRLALSFEMDGARASLIVKHAKFQSRFEAGVCACGLGKTEETKQDGHQRVRQCRTLQPLAERRLDKDVVSALTVATAGTTNTERAKQTDARTHETKLTTFGDSEPPSLMMFARDTEPLLMRRHEILSTVINRALSWILDHLRSTRMPIERRMMMKSTPLTQS